MAALPRSAPSVRPSVGRARPVGPGRSAPAWRFGAAALSGLLSPSGLTVGGIVEDSKLSFTELVHRDLSKWRRCAIVTDHDWLRHATSVFRFMMPREVECFGSSQVRKAVDWAAA